MGRHKTHRDIPLYTRIIKENDAFLDRVERTANLSRTEWIDRHLTFLRNNVAVRKVAKLVAPKTRDKISC